jgi:hypothetical protein
VRDLGDCAGKLRRAEEHLIAVQNEIAWFLNEKPYRIREEREVDGTEHAFYIDIERPIPHRLSLIVGDCLQTLRSSLDHLAWVFRTKDGRVYFAIRKGAPVANKRGTGDSLDSEIGPVRDDARALIKALQPHTRGDTERDPLWVLNELARVDRHQSLHLLGAVSQSTTFSIGKRDANGNFYVAAIPYAEKFEVPKVTFGPFHNGAEAARFILVPAQPEMYVDLQVAFHITFGEATPAPNFPIVPTLASMLGFIRSEVAPRFAALP